MKLEHILAWALLLFVSVISLVVVYSGVQQAGQNEATPVLHDYGRMLTVFDYFCDGWPDNPTPLRCERIVWCWTHHKKEAQVWPLAEAIPFLKELQEATRW